MATDERPIEDWRVVQVVTAGRCRVCGGAVAVGDRAWYLLGHGLQHFECASAATEKEGE